jgi:hypothetical protein
LRSCTPCTDDTPPKATLPNSSVAGQPRHAAEKGRQIVDVQVGQDRLEIAHHAHRVERLLQRLRVVGRAQETISVGQQIRAVARHATRHRGQLQVQAGATLRILRRRSAAHGRQRDGRDGTLDHEPISPPSFLVITTVAERGRAVAPPAP